MNQIRPELPPLPPRIAKLPVDDRGYPVPWFVAWIDGKPDHRIADARKMPHAQRNRLCWVCGERREIDATFVIGPMCVVNRVTSEPPSHYECALFSVKACPFLTRPHAKRREHNIPDVAQDAAGVMLRHNPGVMVLYTCQSYRVEPHDNGVLFRLNSPTQRVEWYREGRLATREEAIAARDIGMPFLTKAAEEGGPEDVKILASMFAKSVLLLPKESP